MATAADREFMRQALALAERGLYTTTPNPRVGCVVVKDGAVVGTGWHEKAGLPHAEALALNAVGPRARGATLYLNLEPCSHHGRTPPCADAIVAARVKRVVAAMQDPNPKVAGAGFARLRAAGIEVEHGLMEEEARELNIGFVARMTRGRPWVRMKIAASLDGRTALANGKSQWITGEAARADGHHWRARACAILTGHGTVRDDDPRLNVRGVDTPRQPLKIVVDSRFETPTSARLLKDGRTLIAGAVNEAARIAALKGAGADTVIIPNDSGKVELFRMMEELARRELNEIHVEGGTRLNGSLLQAGVVDELLVYLAPSVIGDSGRGMFDMPELTELSQAKNLEIREVERLGEDIRILARILGSRGVATYGSSTLRSMG
jgi:diaminohydroxyphosphoribosylaminopyrimidine deaminase/5-amino-6-(5-phosphoribosylamino)uracil reductase